MIKILNLAILIHSLSFHVIFHANVFADDAYPKTQEERLSEKVGSVLGEHKHLSPSIPLNDKDKQKKIQKNKFQNHVKYLWQASVKYLHSARIISMDFDKGILVTDWFVDPDNHYCTKLTIIINEANTLEDCIEIIGSKKNYIEVTGDRKKAKVIKKTIQDLSSAEIKAIKKNIIKFIPDSYKLVNNR